MTSAPEVAITDRAMPPPSVDGDLESLVVRLRRRERELGAIRRISRALHARTNLDELEREALNVAIETLEAEGGTIYLHNPKKQVLVFRYVVGATPEITARLQGMEMPDTTGIAGQVFHSGEGRITLKVSEDRDHNAAVDQTTQFRTESIITVPLKGMDGHSIGVLQVLNRKLGHFDQDDLEILEILGTQAGSVIENARLYDEARRASVINLIGDISHDVKNLLTPVVTGTQTLEMMMDSMFEDFDRAMSGVTPEQREALCWAVDGVRGFYKEAMEMTYDGAQDAQERVREIADAIKGIIAEPHFEDTDFRERAESVARVLRLVGERKGVLIDLSGLQDTGMVELDRKGIYNAIYNLINNAIPETPEGGKIMVRSRLVDFSGQPGLEIQVADTGHGMPPHVRARMFTENAISTKVGGTGLGTRIVKNVVEAHHGRIWVDSEEGKGTTFTIQLPIRQPRGEAVPTASQPA
jgi:signal transduction histidine kinase